MSEKPPNHPSLLPCDKQELPDVVLVLRYSQRARSTQVEPLRSGSGAAALDLADMWWALTRYLSNMPSMPHNLRGTLHSMAGLGQDVIRAARQDAQLWQELRSPAFPVILRTARADTPRLWRRVHEDGTRDWAHGPQTPTDDQWQPTREPPMPPAGYLMGLLRDGWEIQR